MYIVHLQLTVATPESELIEYARTRLSWPIQRLPRRCGLDRRAGQFTDVAGRFLWAGSPSQFSRHVVFIVLIGRFLLTNFLF